MDVVESCVFTPKVTIFYVTDTDDIAWRLIPLETVDYLDDTTTFVSYIPWHFDVYFHFLGRSVRKRIAQIIDRLITRTISVSRGGISSVSVPGALRAIRKDIIRMLKRYYNGSFVTSRFCALLHNFISSLSRDIISFKHQSVRRAPVMLQ